MSQGDVWRTYFEIRSQLHTIFHLRVTLPSPSDVTVLLERWSEGDADARDHLLPLVYDELRRLARHHLVDEHRAETLNTTALVHEAYIKLVRLDRTAFRSRAYFYAVASRAISSISAILWPTGFSTRTCLPAFSASLV